MCRRRPPPCQQRRCATYRAGPQQRQRPAGRGRGGPCWPTPWTAPTLGWSPALWLSLSLRKKGNTNPEALSQNPKLIIRRSSLILAYLYCSKEDEAPLLEEGKKVDSAREGKFLLYWMTTTSTSTTYTATTTLSSVACTPSGFSISNCTG